MKLKIAVISYFLLAFSSAAWASLGQMIELDNGLLIDKSCNEIHSSFNEQKFADIAKLSLVQGVQCLETLGSEHAKSMAFEFHKMLNQQDLSKRPKVYCSHGIDKFQSLDWEAQAFASASPEQNMFQGTSQEVFHPFISIRPDRYLNTVSLKKLFFHEFLHNLNYRHGIDREIPNACEECCFSQEQWQNMSVTDEALKKKDLACRICANDYTNEKEYLSDAVSWSEGSHDYWILTTYLLNGIIKNADFAEEFLLLHLEGRHPQIVNNILSLKESQLNINTFDNESISIERLDTVAAELIVALMNHDTKMAGRKWNVLKNQTRAYKLQKKLTHSDFIQIDNLEKILISSKQVIPFFDILLGAEKANKSTLKFFQ